MRVVLASLALALAACSPAPAPQAEAPAVAGAALSDADRTAVLTALSLTANAEGQVTNECGELVTPRILPAHLGGAVGTAQVVAIDGGPNTATCYGDGPDIHVLAQVGGAWRQIYSDRGGGVIVLRTQTNGVRDIAAGGPGFSFPVFTWNGNEYVPANRQIADSELGDAEFVP